VQKCPTAPTPYPTSTPPGLLKHAQSITSKFVNSFQLTNTYVNTCSKFLTKLDFKAAFNLLRIKPGDESKAAFRCKFGVFEPLVVPFGLANAPAAFQRFVNFHFKDYLHSDLILYLDDMVTYGGATREDHERLVEKALHKSCSPMAFWAVFDGIMKREHNKHIRDIAYDAFEGTQLASLGLNGVIRALVANHAPQLELIQAQLKEIHDGHSIYWESIKDSSMIEVQGSSGNYSIQQALVQNTGYALLRLPLLYERQWKWCGKRCAFASLQAFGSPIWTLQRNCACFAWPRQ